MVLTKVQQYISEYRIFLEKNKNHFQVYKWECLKNFHDNWDLEAADFGKMYNQSFQSTETRRLWKGENFFPKEMMLKFIAISPDFVRAMFKDLLDETKAVEDRISRFQFGCDTLLEEYKTENPLTIENNHYHLENHIISMYLSFQYPEEYTLFQYPVFRKTMEKLGTTKVPSQFDILRFFKVSKTLNTFLQKDNALLETHQNKLNPTDHFVKPSLLLVNDFYHFVASE